MLRIVLKESRAAQLRRELDDAVNGTGIDYGSSIEQADNDPTVARAKGLEIHSEPKPKNAMPDDVPYDAVKETYPNGKIKTIVLGVAEDNEAFTYYESGILKAYFRKGPAAFWRLPFYIEYHEKPNRKKAVAFVYEDSKFFSYEEWIDYLQEAAKKESEWRARVILRTTNQKALLEWEEDMKRSAARHYNEIEKESYLSKHELDDRTEEYKFTKSRKSSSDPRFADLDLASNQPPKKTDDNELGNRAKGLELDEKRKSLKESFAKLLKRPF